MKRILLSMAFIVCIGNIMAHKQASAQPSDRQEWVDLCYQIAQPVLENMSKGELQKNMNLEFGPTWDHRDQRVAYMETFSRLMCGISPWLALPEDNTAEGKMRKQIHQWAISSYQNAVDPNSPDCLLWEGHTQILVDAAFLAQSFIRAPHATWDKLDNTTQQRYIACFKSLRNIRPAYNNWLLFRAIIETFLMEVGEEPDQFAITVAIQKMNEWYLSDGFYSDGPEFALDYYNSYVIQPMYVEILEICERHNIKTPITSALAVKRMQRFNQFLERMISPEGTFPAMGRSITYRMGAFQTLSMAVWKYGLPNGLTHGMVRNALTTVMRNMFAMKGNFDKDNYLQLGFCGHQPGLANSYTNNGSLYLTSTVFLPLGLEANHPFWTDDAEDWTSRKAWQGKDFPIDGHRSLIKEKK